jgi:L-ascorbate metabolism protein UlaG (beta-lactamase superfamily)
MKVTYYGHACFSVVVGGKTLLFDPFISGNPLAKDIDANKVPADFILVSHGHGDHVGDAVEIARRTNALVIASYEVATWFNKQGVSRTHPLNHGGGYKFDFGRVKFVNAIHSSTMPDGTFGGNPGGFVVESVEGNFYYSGDYTMGVDDAVKAAEFIRCNEILGVHYDTFPPIKIDHTAAKEKFKAVGKTLHLLRSGESRDF